MNRKMWRQLASGLLAATLSLGIAACDDDTTNTHADMAVTQDMSANVDMTMPGSPGIGQIVLADVVGTVFTPKAAPLDKLYRTHSLLALASFPQVVPTSDPTSDLSLTPPGGCTINRYTATHLPGPDGDAGDVTITGWNQGVIGVAANGTSSLGTTMYPITCKRGGAGTLMDYTCGYAGMMNSDGGGMGMTTDAVLFPLVAHRCVLLDPTTHQPTGTTCPGTGNLGFPDQFPCVPRYVQNPQDPVTNCTFPTTCATAIEMCEQSPVLTGASNITEAISGGADYGAASQMLGAKGDADAGASEFPQPLYLISVTKGTATTNLAGTDPFTMGPSLSMADGAIDVTQDLTISYSCDGTATVGGGCAGQAGIAALLVKTSTSPRVAFSVSTASGSAECIAAVTAGKITIKAAQLAALLGSPAQSGGSWQLALARLKLLPQQVPPHLIAFTGGMGVFGFTNQ